MAKRFIQKHVVNIKYQVKNHSSSGTLYYCPSEPDDDDPVVIAKAIPSWSNIRDNIEKVRDHLKQVVRWAAKGMDMQNNHLEEAVRALSTAVLPEEGFAATFASDTHPQIDTFMDNAREIPWEILEEVQYLCPDCNGHQSVSKTAEGWFSCREHGEVKKPIIHSQRLAMDYYLTHLAKGTKGAGLRATGGDEFYILEDPRCDLMTDEYEEEKEPNGKKGPCLTHLDQLQQWLNYCGYKVKRVEGPNVTRNRFKEIITSNNCAGLYYFGHGGRVAGQDDGGLLLANNQILTAKDIKETGSKVKFVFLNACWGGACGEDWEIDRNSNSVAEAFALGGGGKVVIAPLWPIVTSQAAWTATLFFEKALKTEQAMAYALSEVRKESLKLYEEKKPHISWMAYRYFGDPNQTLPTPTSQTTQIVVSQEPKVQERVFDHKDQFDRELFSFDIDGLLLRSAKRRNNQRRMQVTVLDFVAGIVRVGDLTRLLFKQLEVDPDDCYKKLETIPEQDDPGCTIQEDDDSSLDPWFIQDRSEFSRDLQDILKQIDHVMHDQSDGARVSEWTVLTLLMESHDWNNTKCLPARDDVKQALATCSMKEAIDENGHILMRDLGQGAQHIINTAHMLSQQLGDNVIRNRSVMAAFLENKDSYAWKLIAEKGADPELVLLTMMWREDLDNESISHFGLTPDVCERCIQPMLARARLDCNPEKMISESDLFKAFCNSAGEELKKLIKTMFEFDLESLIGAPSSYPDANKPEPDVGPSLQSVKCQNSREEVQAADYEKDAWNLVMESLQLCRSQHNYVVRTPYLFLSLLKYEGPHALTELTECGQEPSQLKAMIMSLVPREPLPSGQDSVLLSSNTCAVLGRAMKIAQSKERSKITVKDIDAAFFGEGGGITGEVLRTIKKNPLVSVPVMKQLSELQDERRSLLDEIGEDLTAQAREGKLPEIVARDDEIENALQELSLTENPNPILIGEAGIGKTAIVQGMAQRIAKGDCHKRLRDFRIIQLPVSSLVANTSFHGQFAQRMKMVIREASHKTILFIDEIHTLLGAGAAMDSSLDAGNILKPVLGQGTIRVIGATTPQDYRKTFARDTALSRRFPPLEIKAPTRTATLEILGAQEKRLIANHKVEITAEAKTAAVDLSEKFMPDQSWPAKARDVLDRACAYAESCWSQDERRVIVRKTHVAHAISMRTGIPFEEITMSEDSLLDTLEDRLRQRIVGQNMAISTIVDAMRTAHHGLSDQDRPRSVLLFVGPCGVGKTELAKLLAEILFGGPDGLIRFDMGDFTESHSVAKLLGSPPSYVGYGKGSPLVERLRHRPYSLLLFDEIEHAHEDVLAVLLRLFSEGTLVDADGHIGDARNTTIILTTNLIDPEQAGGLGFSPKTDTTRLTSQASLRKRIESLFPIKLLDRIDRIVPFRSFSLQDLTGIARLQLDQICTRMNKASGCEVMIDTEVYTWLAQQVYQENLGARGMQRALNVHIGVPLGRLLDQREKAPLAAVQIGVSGNRIVIDTAGKDV